VAGAATLAGRTDDTVATCPHTGDRQSIIERVNEAKTTGLEKQRPVDQVRIAPKQTAGRVQREGAQAGLVSWAPLLLMCLTPFLILRVALRPVSDPDTFWHIRAGQYLWSTWQFAGPEPWSQFSSHEWVLHEWVPQLALFAVWNEWGLPGIAWINAASIILLFAALYVTCRRFSGILPAALSAAAAWVGASGSLSPRPQMVTFALALVFTAAWLRTASDGRPRWWLIPLSWLWACSHGMWFAGVLVGLAVIGGMALDGAIRLRDGGKLALIPGLSIGAAALTPTGPGLLLAPLHVGEYTKYVTEWAPPTVKDPAMAMTILMALVVVISWSRSRDRAAWSAIAVLLLAVLWTLLYARTVAVGAVMLAPLVAATLQSRLPHRRAPSRTKELGAVFASVSAVVLLAAALAPHVASIPGRVPVGFDARLSALPPGSVVYNEYALGGWLLLCHSQVAPVIDPRTEVFDLQYVDKYMASRGASTGWQSTVKASGARVAILPSGSPLAAALTGNNWKAVQHDRGYTYLVAP